MWLSVTGRRVTRLALAAVLLAPLAAPAQSAATTAATCQSFPFTVEKRGAQIQFDVADLRRNRPELYRILSQSVVQDLYFGQEQSSLGDRVSTAYLKGSPKDPDQRDRLAKFLVTRVTGPGGLLEKLKFECASFADGMAAELSLVLTKEEGERVLRMVTDPAHEKFLVFMLRSKLTHKVPAQISANINDDLLASFNRDLVESCEEYGIEPATCVRFQVRPPPTRQEYVLPGAPAAAGESRSR
jgi:hypothetical protein